MRLSLTEDFRKNILKRKGSPSPSGVSSKTQRLEHSDDEEEEDITDDHLTEATVDNEEEMEQQLISSQRKF